MSATWIEHHEDGSVTLSWNGSKMRATEGTELFGASDFSMMHGEITSGDRKKIGTYTRLEEGGGKSKDRQSIKAWPTGATSATAAFVLRGKS